ncbi:MAG: mucoidy inhibitor MuiA family protein, partial [Firmicutes bacterium]|nr:mucoidy inhibitor MuiA family protein [Bacillota bacterium]
MTDLYTKAVKARVYRTGAEMTRQGSAELSKGQHTLYVHGLSASSDTDTARIYSFEGISCTDLRFVSLYDDDGEDAEVKELSDKIAALEKLIEAKELQTELWKTNGDFSSRTAQPVSEVQDYIEKLAGRLEGINSEILAAQKEIKELNKKLEKRNEKLSVPVMAADVTVPEDGLYTFELRYFEHAAQWRSVYEIHTDGEGRLEMYLKGNITQNTGEDWKYVDLSLLTGSPALAGTVPELPALFLDIRQPVDTRRNYMGAGAMMKSAMADTAECVEEDAAAPMMAMGMAAPMVRMSMQQASVSQDETSTEYVLPGKRDVLKGGRGTVAELQVYDIPAEFKMAAVPKMDQSAYLVAAVKPEDLPMTEAAEPAIYYKGVYSGKVWLDPDLTKDEIEITLGRQERVHINRKETVHKTSTTLLSGQKVVEYGYETAVTNGFEKPITVVVKDQVP